jgi:microcystin-dependent protein
MGQPYIGEIRIFAGNFNPLGWAMCDSSEPQAISENESLFVLIGTTYGGDGEETYCLPNLASRVPMHQGTGPDGVNYVIGEMSGTEQETLTTAQIPNHTHTELASTAPGTSQDPTGRVLAQATSSQPNLLMYGTDSVATMSNQAIGPAGGNQPHENTQPYLCLNFILSLFGIYPTPT